MTDINKILADNLRYFMRERKLTQTTIGKKAGIGQTTVSLYLNPGSRQSGTSGKASPTLARVESLAQALSVELWELLRPMTPTQRELYRSIEKAFREAVDKALSVGRAAPNQTTMMGRQAAEQAAVKAAEAAIASRKRQTRKALEASAPAAKKPTKKPLPTKSK